MKYIDTAPLPFVGGNYWGYNRGWPQDFWYLLFNEEGTEPSSVWYGWGEKQGTRVTKRDVIAEAMPGSRSGGFVSGGFV